MIRHAPVASLRSWAGACLALVLAALVFCLAPRSSHGADRQGLGPLSSIVFTGSEAGWTGSIEAGVYWLENTAGDASDIRYFYTAPAPESGARRSVRVDVMTAHLAPEGRAGLLYGFRESPRAYHLIMISGRGDVEVFRREGQSFRRLMSTSLGARMGDPVRVEVRESGPELRVLANGRQVGQLQGDGIGSGRVGIAAFGAGRFGFTDYVQTPAVQPPVSSGPRSIASPPRAAGAASPAQPADRTHFIEHLDAQLGIAQYRAPFPKGWRYDTNPNDPLLLTGPGGTKVLQTSSGRYFHADDAYARQSAHMAGARIAPVMPLDRFLEQQFSPYMAQRGYRLVDRSPLPKIVDFMEVFSAAMPQELSRKRFDAIGAEWEGRDGTRAYTQLTQSVLVSRQDSGQPTMVWEVTAMELYASREAYQGARDAFVHAAENTEINPQWQIAKNRELLANLRASRQQWDERTRQSQIQHIGRMNAILARSEASSAVARINSDILDINHAGYLKRSDMVSAGQARTVDMIGGKSVISNPDTGELYRVDAGSRHYWVNGEGQYFRTDDSLYDPRTDRRIGNQQWERFEVVR